MFIKGTEFYPEMAQEAAASLRHLCWQKKAKAGTERELPETSALVPNWVRAILADAYAPLHLRRNEETDRYLQELSRAGVALNPPENAQDPHMLDLIIRGRKRLAVTLLGAGEVPDTDTDTARRFFVPFSAEKLSSGESSLPMAVVCDLAVTGVMPLEEACRVIQAVSDLEIRYGDLPKDQRPTVMPVDVCSRTADNIERAKGVKLKKIRSSGPPRPDPDVVKAEEQRTVALRTFEATLPIEVLTECIPGGAPGSGPLEKGVSSSQPGRGGSRSVPQGNRR